MSQNDTTVGIVFDLQRSAIEGTHEVVQNSVQFQQEFNARLIEGFGPARDVSQVNNDLVRTGFAAYFDAVEAALPGEREVFADVRSTVDEQLDTLEESQAEALDQLEANLREGVDSVDEFLDDFLGQVDEQIESVLDAHEDLEDQTVDALEDLEAQVEELQAEFEDRGEEFQEQFEEQLESLQEQIEESADSIQRQVEDVTGQFEDAVDVEIEGTDASA